MQSICRLLTLIGLSLGSFACASKTYQVTVVNQTATPITVGVVKDHGPSEEGLTPVERLAIDSSLESMGPWGFVIPPGKTGDTQPITGKFSGGAQAYLRVYRGTGTNAELISVGSSNPHRLDVLLFPGARNEIIVKDGSKKLEFVRVSPKLQ